MSVAQYNSQGGSVPNWEAGMGVHYYLQEKAGHVYLRRVTFQGGKPDDRIVGNVEVLVAIHDFFESRGIRLTVRNVKKILEQVLEGSCPKPKRRVEGRSPQPRILAGPGGFEPPTTGLGETHSMARSSSRESGNSQNNEGSSRPEALGILPWPPREPWLGWLQVDEATRWAYASYYDKLQAMYPQGIPLEAIPELSRAKWYRYTIRKLAQYAWLQGMISLELKARIEQLARAPAKREIPHAPDVSVEDLKRTLEALRDGRYRLMYLIMYYSGARLAEAEHLIRTAKELRPLTFDQALEYRGYLSLGKAVRIALHYNRGKKRCEFLWLPAWLFELIQEYQGEPRARALTSYVRNLKTRQGLDVMDPKLVRKLHYQLMEQAEVDRDIRELVQNRLGRATVGDIAYSRILRRADEEYEQRILPFLEERLGLVRG